MSRVLRGLGATLAAVVLGVLSAVPGVLLHLRPWTLPLTALVALAWLLALPPGLARLAYAVSWAGVVALFAAPRAGGDLVVVSSLPSYLLVGFALALVGAALVSLPRTPRDSEP